MTVPARKSASSRPATKMSVKKVVQKNAKAKTVTKAAASKSVAVRKTDASSSSATKQPAKRVRGTFVMPQADYALISALKSSTKRIGLKVKKSELLRLGLQALRALSVEELRDRVVTLQLAERPKSG